MNPLNEPLPPQPIPDAIDRQKHPICTLWWFFIFLLSAMAMSFAALIILITQKKDGIFNLTNQIAFDLSCPMYIKNKYSINNYLFKSKVSSVALCIVCVLGLLEIFILLIEGRKGLCFCEYENKWKYRKWIKPMENVLNATGIIHTLPTVRQPLINKTASSPQTKPQTKPQEKQENSQPQNQPYKPIYPFNPLFFIFIFLHLLFLMVPFSTHFTELIEWKICNSFDVTQKKLSLVLGIQGAALLLGLLLFVLAIRYKWYLENGRGKNQVQKIEQPEKKIQKEPQPLVKEQQSPKKEVKESELVKQESQAPEVTMPELSPIVEKQQQKPSEIKVQEKPIIKVEQKSQSKNKEDKKPQEKQKYKQIEKPLPKQKVKAPKQQQRPKEQQKLGEQEKKSVVEQVVHKAHEFEKSGMNFNINVKVDMPQTQQTPQRTWPRKSRSSRYDRYEEGQSQSEEEYTGRKSRKSRKNRISSKSRMNKSRMIESDEDQAGIVMTPKVKEISTQTVVDREIQTESMVQIYPLKSQYIPQKSHTSQGINTLDIQDSLNKAIQTDQAKLINDEQIMPIDFSQQPKPSKPIQIQMVSMTKSLLKQQTTKNSSEQSNITSSIPFQFSLTMTPSQTSLKMTPSFSNLVINQLIPPNVSGTNEQKQIKLSDHEKIGEFDKLNEQSKPMSPINKKNFEFLMETNSFIVNSQEELPPHSIVMEENPMQEQQKKQKNNLGFCNQVLEVQEKPLSKRNSSNRISPIKETQIIIQPKPSIEATTQKQAYESTKKKLNYVHSIFTIEQSSPFSSFNSNVMVSKAVSKAQGKQISEQKNEEKAQQRQKKPFKQLQIYQLPSLVLQSGQKTDYSLIEERFNPTNNKLRIEQEQPDKLKKEIPLKEKVLMKESIQRDKDSRVIIAEVNLKSEKGELEIKQIKQAQEEESLEFQVHSNKSGSELYSSVKRQVNNSSDRILTNQMYIESDANLKFTKKSLRQNLLQPKPNKIPSIISKFKRNKKSQNPKSSNFSAQKAELDAKVNQQSLKHLKKLNFDSVLKPKSLKDKIIFLSDISSSQVQSTQLKNHSLKRQPLPDPDKQIPLIRRLLSIAQLQGTNSSQQTTKKKKIAMKSFKKGHPYINVDKILDSQVSSSYKQTPTAKLTSFKHFNNRNRRFQKKPLETGTVYYNEFCDSVYRRKSESKRKSIQARTNTKSMRSFGYV